MSRNLSPNYHVAIYIPNQKVSNVLLIENDIRQFNCNKMLNHVIYVIRRAYHEYKNIVIILRLIDINDFI